MKKSIFLSLVYEKNKFSRIKINIVDILNMEIFAII